MPQLSPTRSARTAQILALSGLWVAGILAFGLLIWLIFAPMIHLDRLWDTETKLGVFEGRIAGVGDEMLRRSAVLQQAFKEFEACMPTCEQKVFDRRDSAVRRAWHDVYERLLVEKDWGTLITTEGSHHQFRAIVREHGKDGALMRCVPKLGFYNGRRGGSAYTLFEGFDCSASGKSGG